MSEPESTPGTPAAPAGDSSPAPKPAPARRGRGLLLGLMTLPLLAGSAGLGLWWGLGSEAGSRWLLQQVPGLQVEAPQGSLIGDFSAQRLSLTIPGGQDRIEIDDLRWTGLSLAWNRSPLLWGDLMVERLSARQVTVHLAPSAEPSPVPEELPIPLGVHIAQLQVERLSLPTLSPLPVRGLLARVDLSTVSDHSPGAEHRLQIQQLAWDQMQLSGSATLGAGSGLPLQASLGLKSAAQADLPAWGAQLELHGPLAQLQLQAALSAQNQQLQAQAQLRPFAAWPLPQLQLDTQQLDLSALMSGLPKTALSGQVSLLADSSTTGKKNSKQPALLIKAQLANHAAGLWNEQRLPVRQLSLDAEASAQDPSQIQLRAFDVLLGSSALPAGRLRGSGKSSSAGGSQLTLSLENLRSEGLDARAAGLLAAGTVELSTSQGLIEAGNDASGQHDKKSAASSPPLQLRIKTDLQGRWLPPGPVTPAAARAQLAAPAATSPQNAPLNAHSPVRLQASAVASMQGLDLQELLMQAGEAQLKGSAKLAFSRPGSLAGGWQLQANARGMVPELRRLWPQAPGPSARLDLDLSADLQAPALQSNAGLLAQAPRGQARLRLLPGSQAGMELAADLSYERANDQQVPTLRADLQAGGNQLQGRAQLLADHSLEGQLQLQAPQLQALQPLWQALAPALAKGEPAHQLAGSLSGQLAWQGRAEADKSSGKNATSSPPRWSWQSQTELQGQALKLDQLSLDKARLNAKLASALSAPLALQLDLEQLKSPEAQLPQAQLNLSGSWAQHQLQLSGLGTALLPAALRPAHQPADQPSRSQFQIGLKGSLGTAGTASPAASELAQLWAQGGQWRASGLKLDARVPATTAASKTAKPADKAPAPWLQAQDLALRVDSGPQGQLSGAQFEPGRLELLGAGLRWQQLAWKAAEGPDQLQLDLALEPLSVAPLMARWQPDFGWGGDLVVDGSARIHTLPQLGVELSLQRRSGDLKVTDDGGTQALGLSELRLGVIGAPGRWHLTQAFAGSNIGVLAGAVTARNEGAEANPWPSAQSHLEGVLEVRVDNLSTWGAWVPSGWRVAGGLAASASFAGKLNDPQVVGQIQGSKLGLRNPLLGIDVQDGSFALQLKGSHAELQQLRLRAGEGELNAQGKLQLGAKPQADIQAQASKFALLRRVDRRLAVNGQLRLHMDAQALDLQGKLDVEDGLFDFSRGNAPELDDDVEVRRVAQVPAAPAESAAARRQIKLKLDIDLGQKLRVRGHGVDTLLAGELQMTQAQGRPQLHGSIRTVNGSVDAYGQKLTIEKGQVTFSGVMDNPRLDILAIRPGEEEVRVGVTIGGSAQSPRIKLFSDPDMADTAKLSWLLLGRAPDNLERSDTALLQKAAMALLNGGGESRTGKVIKSIGLDELSVSEGNGEVRGTVVRVGKQLSKRWYVAFERGLNATQGSWQLIYRIAQRFTLRGQAGDENALDLIWQWKWE
ncbi:translocation/assembly module TamB domain-containing protein [Kinneretia aquatilis]|uniref:translocation/assembly module TamB domain-containing protein n=1 Tax=Kinneretia aquatilis TaxID=2070761 RepID=UPI0014951F29|nr:translocation/assembly module TamB domain-containing protein [Paucibacter aquatile]WIV96488.1 translocation/assembly module TamB domain-containing protein [Paucibacter aquatile]